MTNSNKTTDRRPSLRIAQKRRDARQEIINAAEEILAEEGAEGITLAAVSAKLNLTKQALYHYFPSKEALAKSLTTSLLHKEVESIISSVKLAENSSQVLGIMIQAFYSYYINRLNAFRMVYCQSQLRSSRAHRMDEEMIREEINPRTRHLFDVLESTLSSNSMKKSEREKMRRLAFSAWLSALGLLSMLALADATQDPLIHTDNDLLATLITVFNKSVTEATNS